MSTSAFPPGFLWGVATSAQQIEGATTEDGRGESIWDRYASVPGNISDGTDSRIACDHYHRWRDDVVLLRELGVNAYRFSIAWPRILPEGSGRVNLAGLDFYDRLVDALLAAGIRPFVTLYHWDLPQALQDDGGWGVRATVNAFTEFTDVVSRRLGDRVRHWVTHNEPWCVSHLGHEMGVHAPGHRDPEESLRVAHHVMLSHGRALGVLHANAPGAQAGAALILSPIEPATDSDADRDAARELDGSFNRWFLDPLLRGAYPEDALADRVRRGHLRGARRDYVHPGDLATIATPADFVGVNYYSRIVVKAGENGMPVSVPQGAQSERTDMDWEVHPQGFYDVLMRLHRDYHVPRIHVTENGAAYTDPVDAAGYVDDARRVAYLHAHLASAQRAVADGVPLAGYFAWSFMDNFEWGQGLSKRFGLHHVDYTTQRRIPRASAAWYRETIARGSVDGAAGQHNTRRLP